jgi:hypothetical protein
MTTQEPQAVAVPVPDPSERLEELMEGFQVTQALYVAAKLNLADALRDGPKTATELASSVGAHAPSLLRLMRYLVRVGVLAEADGDRFALTHWASHCAQITQTPCGHWPFSTAPL